MNHHTSGHPWYNRNSLILFITCLIAAGIFAPVFTSDYLYLDEAYQLWNRNTDRNYHLFTVHGRLLSGIFFQKAFHHISTVHELIFLRIMSLTGWILSSWLLFYFSKQWVKQLDLPPFLPFLLAVFCICSSSVTVYVAWASCAQVFMAFLFGLISGHIMFLTLRDPGKSRLNFLWVIITGIVSLLIYQTCFGVFILPFLLLWLAKDSIKKNKTMLTGIAVYFCIYLLYFLLFLYYRESLNTGHDSRTDLVFQPFKKISFFFGAPFSQAWSLNMLQNLHNIFSQLLPVVLMITWLVLFIRQTIPRNSKTIVIQLTVIIFLLLSSYLPSLVAKENFSSYRTMIILGLCVFLLFNLTILKAIKPEKAKLIYMCALSALLFFIGFLNFNRKFIGSLKKEYAALHQLPVFSTVKKDDTIIFIRADSKMFRRLYGVKSYKDEFGSPSTLRDWVPENLTRQLIEEKNSVEVAKAVTFYQYANSTFYNDSMKVKPVKPYVIDINEVLKK